MILQHGGDYQHYCKKKQESFPFVSLALTLLYDSKEIKRDPYYCNQLD